jgi:hypothetical protein
MKTSYLPLYKMPTALPVWECLNPSYELGHVKNGTVKNPFNKSVDFSENAGRHGLYGFGPDLVELSSIQFSVADICSIVVKIKFNDDINTLDNTRVLGFDERYWRFADGWQPIEPEELSIKKKHYTAGKLRKMLPDEYGFITLVHVVDTSELETGALNYNPATSYAIGADMRFDRIPTGDIESDRHGEVIEPNGINNITFSLCYIAVYNGDVSYLENPNIQTKRFFVAKDNLLTNKDSNILSGFNDKTMKERIVINIDKEPLVKTYPYYSFLFSVIGKDHPYFENWVLSEMTMLYYRGGYDIYKDRFLYNENYFRHKLIDTIEISDNLIDSEKTFHECIIEHLNMGYAAIVEIEEFYIPERIAYKKYKNSHNNMIYGYDPQKNTYLLAGYDGGYVNYIEANAKDLYKAFTEKTRFFPICFIRKNNTPYPIDWWNLSRDLKSYCEGININDLYCDDLYIFGINAIKKFVLLIEAIKNNGHGTDVRLQSMIYEHKILLSYKYELLLKNGVTFRYKNIGEKLDEIKEEARVCFNLLIKYAVNKDIEYLTRMQNIVKKIIETEEVIFPILIDAVDEHKRSVINLKKIAY